MAMPMPHTQVTKMVRLNPALGSLEKVNSQEAAGEDSKRNKGEEAINHPPGKSHVKLQQRR